MALDIDFGAHNREAKEVWDRFNAGSPVRVPVLIGVNSRFYIFNPALNTSGTTFQEYSEDPDVMIRVQLEFQYYQRHNLIWDTEMGMPKERWATIYVDLQNTFEAAWFGCPVHYREGQVPDTTPILTGDNKRMLFDRGIPDPFRDGIMAKNLRFYEIMSEKLKDFTFKGLPVNGASPYGIGTDGPFTAASNLRGATEICLDIYEDPDYVKELMEYITEATILRIRAWRERFGHKMRPDRWGFADDSIQLLSTDAFREFVLPYHRRLISELAGAGPHSIHLCGDASRHFPILRDELNIKEFDTGFPVDFAALRRDLGPDVRINGGPSVQFLIRATPAEVRKEVRRILSSGIMEGGRFVLREGNNLAPNTPEENVVAMHAAAREFGGYC